MRFTGHVLANHVALTCLPFWTRDTHVGYLGLRPRDWFITLCQPLIKCLFPYQLVSSCWRLMAVAGSCKSTIHIGHRDKLPPPRNCQSLGEKCAYFLTSWQKHPCNCFNFPSFMASRLVVIEYLQCVHNVMQEMCIVKFCRIGQDPQITEL